MDLLDAGCRDSYSLASHNNITAEYDGTIYVKRRQE
jgi:hypothetical protein